MKHGVWNYYHESGEPSETGNYNMGEEDGVWTGYLKDGKISYTGTYQNGNRIGEWKYYHDNGVLSEKDHLMMIFKQANGCIILKTVH
ncbi:MAG: hypothetical protein IPM74_11785 [Crocinitomicaceae bacterium]|nr:hypothetical protein [Crocinitomicaceae bacterium]